MTKTKLLIGVSSLALALAMSSGAQAQDQSIVVDSAVASVSYDSQEAKFNDVSVLATGILGQATLDSSMHITDTAFQLVQGVQAIGLNTGANAANAAGVAAQVFTNNGAAPPSQEITATDVSASVNVSQAAVGNSVAVNATAVASTALLDSSMLIDDTAFEQLLGVQAVALNTGANAANAAGVAAQIFTNLDNGATQDINADTVSASVSLDQYVADNNVDITASLLADADLDSSMVVQNQAFQEIRGVQAVALNTGADAANAASVSVQVFTNMQ